MQVPAKIFETLLGSWRTIQVVAWTRKKMSSESQLLHGLGVDILGLQNSDSNNLMRLCICNFCSANSQQTNQNSFSRFDSEST